MRHQHIILGVVGVAAALAMASGTQAQPVSPTKPIVTAPTTPLPAVRVSPNMLAAVSPDAQNARAVRVQGGVVWISTDQLAAYDRLPADVKSRMGPAVDGKALSVAELAKLAQGGAAASTVMCPWPWKGARPEILTAAQYRASAITPTMLQTVSPQAQNARVVMTAQGAVWISTEQLAAYDSLPAEVKSRMGPAVDGKALSVAELAKLAQGGAAASTVMCPWPWKGARPEILTAPQFNMPRAPLVKNK
jgi:hypothetical protein